MYRFAKLFIFVVLASFAFSSVLAQDKAGAGDQVPSLELNNQNGEKMSFETLRGENGLVVAFVRSLDWCPYCKSQVIELSKNANAIRELGYNVATISYDAPKTLKTFADKFEVEINLLSDPGSETIKAFGILNEEFDADHFAYGVPHPHIYIISDEGVILKVLAEEGYKERPSIKDILQSLSAQ